MSTGSFFELLSSPRDFRDFFKFAVKDEFYQDPGKYTLGSVGSKLF